MQLYRGRLCALGCLLFLYLAGVLLLSSITLDPHANYSRSATKTRGLELGAEGRSATARRSRLHWCQALRFLDPPGPVVALASFPGSGNTWLRYLLQQATGVHTGSVYKDYGLLKNGFPAESVSNGSVLVVKTHEWGPVARAPFSKAVLLIREPGPAIQAEFNRQSGGHVGFASPDRYRRNRGKYWHQFVKDKLTAWRRTNLDWLRNFTGSVEVVRYESLLTGDLAISLGRLLSFLGVATSEEQLACAVARREGIYRRRRRAVVFDPFTDAMKDALRREERAVDEAVRDFVRLQRGKETSVSGTR